jgi:hypothetical protein
MTVCLISMMKDVLNSQLIKFSIIIMKLKARIKRDYTCLKLPQSRITRESGAYEARINDGKNYKRVCTTCQAFERGCRQCLAHEI